MGLTPLEGVPMGTRCGDMDPAIVIYLMNKLGLDAKGMDNYMNKKSGMLGISGVSSDFRDLGAAAAEGNERAELALRTFAYKVKNTSAHMQRHSTALMQSCSPQASAKTTRECVSAS